MILQILRLSSVWVSLFHVILIIVFLFMTSVIHILPREYWIPKRSAQQLLMNNWRIKCMLETNQCKLVIILYFRKYVFSLRVVSGGYAYLNSALNPPFCLYILSEADYSKCNWRAGFIAICRLCSHLKKRKPNIIAPIHWTLAGFLA